VTHKENKSQLR